MNKEIEEMARICTCKDIRCKDCEYKSDNVEDCTSKHHAELIYNADYRKAEEVRNETAKEIITWHIKEVKKKINETYVQAVNGSLYFGGQYNAFHQTLEALKKLAKEYGVEVEE